MPTVANLTGNEHRVQNPAMEEPILASPFDSVVSTIMTGLGSIVSSQNGGRTTITTTPASTTNTDANMTVERLNRLDCRIRSAVIASIVNVSSGDI